MALTEHSLKLILDYFVSVVGELQNEDPCFHAFGPFRKLTRHHSSAPSAKVFICMTYRPFLYMWYIFHSFGPLRKLSRSQTVLAPTPPAQPLPD